MPTNDQPQVITVLECLECGARDEAAEGWRAYLGPTRRASHLLHRVLPARVRRLTTTSATVACSPRSPPPRSSVSTRARDGTRWPPARTDRPRVCAAEDQGPGRRRRRGAVALAIARRTRALLRARGFRVALTRDDTGYRGGNRERARFCNARARPDAAHPRGRLRRSARAGRRDARAGVAARLDGRRARRERPCRSAPARGSSPQPNATSAWSSAPT